MSANLDWLPRCGDCAHWAKTQWVFARHARPCQHPDLRDVDEAGGYDCIGPDDFGLDYPVCDLMTGPDFGCRKWQPVKMPSSSSSSSSGSSPA